jgi:hypothetical protein
VGALKRYLMATSYPIAPTILSITHEMILPDHILTDSIAAISFPILDPSQLICILNDRAYPLSPKRGSPSTEVNFDPFFRGRRGCPEV